MVTAVIDRFEGSWAVIEYDGTVFNFPRALLPEDAREGDVLKFGVKVSPSAAAGRRKTIKRLEDELFK